MKRNVAIALTRANMGIIRNLCGINWIIEPLGARLYPVYPPTAPAPPTEKCDPSVCVEGVAFEVCQTGDWMYGCPSEDVCSTLEPLPKVQAFYDRGCDRPAGLPQIIWPGVLAASCLVRSMMPPTCPSTISECC